MGGKVRIARLYGALGDRVHRSCGEFSPEPAPGFFPPVVNGLGSPPVSKGVTRVVPTGAERSAVDVTTRSRPDAQDGPDAGLRWGRRVSDAARTARAPVDLRRIEDLEAAYRAHAAELERFAARQLRDHAAAADVVQEVFVRAWRYAERYDAEVASLRVWLFSIARNVVVDHVRHHRSRPSRPTPPEDLTAMAESVAGSPAASSAGDAFSDDLVTAWFVEEALARLGADQRHAIVETYVRGRPYAEVAGDAGVPVGTLRSRVFYGLKNLRQIMDDMGVPL
jgi:RNA polymerase sigma-70 factor, ECF subfamily